MNSNNLVNIPKHVAIIPDGNRRWAKKQGLQPWDGHDKGFRLAEDIAYSALDLGIKNLTIWCGSYDNLTKRPKREIATLDRIYKRVASNILKNNKIHEHKVRIHVLGEWRKLLKKDTIKTLIEAQNKTKNYTKNNLTFLIGYNGNREMINAIKKIKKEDIKIINSKTIKSYLWTKDLPEVDLVIRTAGEPHLSAGFMMWDIQNAELYFSEKMWPDFTKKELKKAIDFYSNRERRFGK